MGSNKLISILQDIDQAVEEDFTDCQPIKQCAKTFNIKPSHFLFVMLLIVIVICLLTSYIAHFAITLFALLYPSYMSFKAINSKQKQICRKWLIYWVVFSFATVFDKVISVIFSFVPAFYVIKVLFFIWMFYPRTDGASKIYEKLLKPKLNRLNQSIQRIKNA